MDSLKYCLGHTVHGITHEEEKQSGACVVKLKYNGSLNNTKREKHTIHGESTCRSFRYWHSIDSLCLMKCTEHDGK